MRLSTLIMILSVFLFLTGCVGDGVLMPKANLAQDIKGIQVTYILPHGVEQSAGTVNGLRFKQYNCGPESKRERLHINSKHNGLLIERRTDNGVAGSGVIYNVDVNTISKPDSTWVILTPKTQETYQQGVVLPFPVPDFDIESYLSSAVFDYVFELNSEYNGDSIKANFDRLLGKDSTNYRLNLNDEQFDISIKIYPYRNGTKVVADITIYNQKTKNGVINVIQKIERVKEEIRRIVNS